MPAEPLSPAWRAALVRLGAAWALLLVLFFADWRDMVAQWWGSSTYNHILLIPPILGWLVAQRRAELLRLTPQGWWPPLVLFAAAGLLWLLGEFAGMAFARQVAVVVMAQAAVMVTLGPQVVAGLLFPLFYMLFLVPFGDELIPFLQTLTARLTMVFLHHAGIPATISGVFITTPAGYFEVAEACSGVKFLIAMIAYGALVANVCFLRWPRRAAFMAVSVVVPILANGARAFGTIWIAGWYGIQFASSFDHVFYGWVFFAVVMALCMAVGWRFFDRSVDAPMIDPDAISAAARVRRMERFALRPLAGFGAMALIAAGFVGWGASVGWLDAKLPAGLRLPDVHGWQAEASDDGRAWVPLHGGAARHYRMRFRSADGKVVDLSFALYANQGEGREAAGFGQGAVPPYTRWAWERPGPAIAGAKSEIIQAPTDTARPERRLALTWYRSGDLITGSNLALRLHVMRDHLLFRRQATAVLILSASDQLSADPQAALSAFLLDIGPVDRWIDHLSSGER